MEPRHLLLPAPDGAVPRAHLDSAVLRSHLVQHQPLRAQLAKRCGHEYGCISDAHNMPGAISESEFDNWYAGFMDWAHVFRGEISFFTETALYEYATPHFYTVNDFPKEFRDLRALSMYTTPWQGGWWHLKDAVDYMVGGSMSVLDLAAKNRETLIYDRYQSARDNIDLYRKEPPFAYVIPSKQADTPEAGQLGAIDD